ncbi:MAG: hypothetical protein GXP31_03785 [Kiritimatiellaeota bacterium]|nr:hypothetical protein [Kiritimatiellota bacterium]
MKPYSEQFCRELAETLRRDDLLIPFRPTRFEAGETLEVRLTGVSPPVEADAVFRIEEFAGGGFAGQVYRCRLERLTPVGPGASAPDLTPGAVYAVKILRPPSAPAHRFRNLLYWLGYQGHFRAEVTRAACRTGVLWQKIVRRAAAVRFRRNDAVADIYASLFEPRLGAYGEVSEWIEGRNWRLEADDCLRDRRKWRTVDLGRTQSPEYVAKRRFMADLVELLHEMGGAEFARQYEWWTLKSQPNVLKRTAGGADERSDRGLCAIDFRAGLALLPFLPMSPADVVLILKGLLRGRIVQFDRCDEKKLEQFVAAHVDDFADLQDLIEEWKQANRMYRRSLPDLTRQGLRLLVDRGLRRDVRNGFIEAWESSRTVVPGFAGRLRSSQTRFFCFYLLGVLPFLGGTLRRLWGNPHYRRHFGRMLTSWSYFLRSGRARIAARLIDWVRAGRVSETRARRLVKRPWVFWPEAFTLGLVPIPSVHRALTEPGFAWAIVRAWFRFVLRFYRDPVFRREYLVNEIRLGEAAGMLTPSERDAILARVDDPYIVRYLRSLAVHFATLPVTQIVSVFTGGIAAVVILSHGGFSTAAWKHAGAVFGGVVLFFQVTPVSPGSLCRGFYVVYLAIRERNLLDYLIALPVSFLKYFGYLAFPLQMTTTYPELSRFMAARWATSAVHIVPVFGEKGALLEHFIFDLCFNLPRAVGRWCRPRLRYLLDAWLVLGVGLWMFFWVRFLPDPLGKLGVNATMIVLVFFVLPRLVFLPLLERRARSGPARP